MAEKVTGEEVRQAVTAAGIARVDHHKCSMCGYMTHYSVNDGQLFFNPGCHCGTWRGPEPKSWDDAAAWINMQSDPAWNVKLRAAFGITS